MWAMVRGLALVGVVLFPLTVHANGLRWSRSSYYYSAPAATSYRMVYVEPAPVYATPVYTSPAPVCPSVETAPVPRNYAQPQPAGPSSGPLTPRTSEPPRAPIVTESRSYFNAYSVAPRSSDSPGAERCRVGFWNLTAQDLTLTIAGKTYHVQRGTSVRLDLDRQFTWRVDNREVQNEQVATGESALEIVIRR
jgi:hypothetical protein